jgi:ABC-2 type transport system ATP-binding protein
MFIGAVNRHAGFMIVAKELTKRYGGTLAVDHLSFEVSPGVVTGFLGPNGSGKSTTMRMIMGLDNPSSGSALVNGKEYAQLKWPLREVGALLDAKAIHPARRAYDHLLFLAQSNDIPRSRIDEVLDVVGLTDVARQRAGKYSLGMGQRLGIAAALLGDPGVLLFDEPINGLDPEGIRWARHLLRDLAAEGRTVLVSSHLINEMALTAERLVVIGRGTLIAETSVSEFTSRGALDAVRVVSPMTARFLAELDRAGAAARLEDDGSIVATGLTSAEIGELAAVRSLTLHELSPLVASLEDAFMELTHESVEFHTASPHAR